MTINVRQGLEILDLICSHRRRGIEIAEIFCFHKVLMSLLRRTKISDDPWHPRSGCENIWKMPCHSARWTPTWRIIPGLVSIANNHPPFISHEVRPFARGSHNPLLGDLGSPWLLTTYPSHGMLLWCPAMSFRG